MNRNRIVIYSVLLGFGLFSWYLRSSLENHPPGSAARILHSVILWIVVVVLLGWLTNTKIKDLIEKK